MKSDQKIELLRLPYPVDGRYWVLKEDDFVRLYLNSDKSMKEVAEEACISIHSMNTSTKYYRQKYEQELITKNSRNLSKSAYLREDKNDPRPDKEVIVDKERLKSLIAEGHSEFKIAEILGIAPQTVRKNIRKYHLTTPTGKLQRLSIQEWQDLEWVDKLVPGILETSYRALDDPSKYFHVLYDGFVAVCRILWTLQKLARRYDSYKIEKKVVRDHISWRINKQEIALSERLREEGIPHIRDYFWAKEIGRSFAADLFIEESNLLIEVNGTVHSLSKVKENDEDKRKIAEDLGYRRITFSSKEVDHEIDAVVEEIKKEMKKL